MGLALLLLLFAFALAGSSEVEVSLSGHSQARATGDKAIVMCKVTKPNPIEEMALSSVKLRWVRVGSDGSLTNISDITDSEEMASVRTRKIAEDPGRLDLFFLDIQEEQKGLYRCIVDFYDKEYTAEFNLKIYQKIQFEDCEANQHPTAGRDGLIKCIVREDPKLEIYWYKDGNPFIPTERTELRRQQMELHFESYNPEVDDGKYTVEVVKKEAGAIEIRDITASGHVGPEIVDWDEEVEGLEGVFVTLTCKATGKPAPSYRWFKGDVTTGKRLNEGEKYSMKDGALTIQSLNAEDKGDYTCSAQNDVTRVTATATLKVIMKPVIEVMSNETVQKGASVILNCRYTGDGPITAYWKFKGQMLKAPNPDEPAPIIEGAYTSLEGNNLVLHLDDVDLDDADEYQCVASNNAGDDMERVFVSVIHPPILFAHSTEPVRAIAGSPATLYCEVEAVPSATFSWTKDGSKIVSDGSKYNITSTDVRTTLYVVANDESDFGTYVCIADNNVKPALNHPIQLLQIVKPPQPEILEAIGNHPNYAVIKIESLESVEPGESPRNVTFYFAEEGDYQDGVTEFDFLNAEFAVLPFGKSKHYGFHHNDVAKKSCIGDTKNEYTVSPLLPQTSYVFKARTGNEAGFSQLSSEPLYYTTSEPRPPAQPVFVTSGSVTCRQSCELRWSEPNAHGSDITEYRLKYFQISTDPSGDNPKMVGSAHWTETLPAHERSLTLRNLEPNSQYEFQLVAINERGESPPNSIIVITNEMAGPAEGLSTGMVVVIVMIVLLLLIVAVDLTCCLVNDAGVLAHLSIKFCGRKSRELKVKEIALEDGGRTDDRTPLKEKSQEPTKEETVPMISNSGKEPSKTVHSEV